MSDEVKKKGTSIIPRPASLISKLMRALRGDLDARTVALEVWRRGRASTERRRERASLDQLDHAPAKLRSEFARLTSSELLEHFRQRQSPNFFPGFDTSSGTVAELQKTLHPSETAQLIESAARIAQKHRWPLMGYAEQEFGDLEWRRDLLSGEDWPLDYHADLDLAREGCDVRIVWEVNRLAHLVTLGRAYTVTRDETLAEEFFVQLASWHAQNPIGRGPNWACAMEAALRAMNLLAAFQLFRGSSRMNEERLSFMLKLFDQHGSHIRRNLEFSYIATSNHYLSDITGLLWLGLLLPELYAAKEWRDFGLSELLREMDVQVLGDGADGEASTGYHRLVVELFLYSFLLCRANEVAIPDKHWRKLYGMIDYVRAYLRPDGRAPLIGDTDSGQVLPLVKRAADDHGYLLAISAAVFNEGRFKLSDDDSVPEEVLWLLGVEGVHLLKSLSTNTADRASQAFPDAGTYVLRSGDLYMLFNASGCGVHGRGSHGHNDSLSIEVSACGTSFIADPGTYVYRTDLHERHLFRSTAYHSTVEVDGEEQNTIAENLPFVAGDEAHPRVIRWDSTDARDLIVAEHDGYARLAQPVTHTREVEFDKRRRFWLVTDTLRGDGRHLFRFRFHLAPGLESNVGGDGILDVCDKIKDARLLIVPLDAKQPPELEARWSSRDYGAKVQSVSACWTLDELAPATARWALIPICNGEDESERFGLVESLRKMQ